MTPWTQDFLGFGIAFLVGVGVGQAVKWPLRGLLMTFGALALAYALVDPQGAESVGKSLAQGAVARILEAMGYPGGWAEYLFTPQWGWVLHRLVEDAMGFLGSLVQGVGQGGAAEKAVLVLLSRWDLAFGAGVIAGAKG